MRALVIELLRSGAPRATNVGIVATYEQPPRELQEMEGSAAVGVGLVALGVPT